MIPGRSQDGDGDTRARFGLPPLASTLRELAQSARHSSFAASIAVIAIAIALVAGLTYYGAREFNERAADTRASNEASTFAQHSGSLATGDAFDGYIQILRDAEDPVVASKGATQEQRVAAMQQLLYLNVNRFSSLTIADRSGLVLATTDPAIVNVRTSQTFSETRANLSPANSDVILPETGKPGYVEYTAALREPDGTSWAILVARADPGRLWTAALSATVDGSRNVIVNSNGQFAAGVPDALLGQPWKGSAVGSRGVRASIDGVDSICGLAPIGKDTQIDRGLNVASCLPASVIQAEHGQAMGKQGLVTAAGAVLALVLAAGLLRLGVGRLGPASASAAASPDEAPDLPDEAADEPEADARLLTVVAEPIDDDPVAEDEPEPPPPALDVDALALIDAYEQRNARLAERLRESVQAKLLIAATQAQEAYRLQPVDEDLASNLHAHVLGELEHIRERELRAIGQELHPAVVRLGLPAALRAMRKDLADLITVTLDLDASADAVVAADGRTSLSVSLRLVLYRFAFDSARALLLAGASTCAISLRRSPARIVLAVEGSPRDEDIDREPLAASAIALEAHGGSMDIRVNDENITLTADAPAPPMPPGLHVIPSGEDGDTDIEGDDPEADRSDAEADHLPQPALATIGDGPPTATGLVLIIEGIRDAYAGEVEIDLGADLGGGAELAPSLVRGLAGLVDAAVASLAAAGASACDVRLMLDDSTLSVKVSGDAADASLFDAQPLHDHQFAIEAFDGTVTTLQAASRVTVSALVDVAPSSHPNEPGVRHTSAA